MDDGGGPHLWGRERRYMLTELLWERGPMTVAELAATLATDGWQVGGRPSKTISDALRWEVAHGRVVRLGRGLYGPGRMPKQTKSWIRCRNRRTRLEAQEELAISHQATDAQALIIGPAAAARSGGAASAPRAQGPSQVDRTRPNGPIHGHSPHPDDDVVVVGTGWSEEEDADEDERARQCLLTRLGRPPRSGPEPRG